MSESEIYNAHGSTSWYGKINEFIPGECFTSYKELAEEFFFINRIEGDLRRSFLLTSIGSEAYEKLRTLVHPRRPTECSIDRIWQVLQNHYTKKINVQAERLKFLNDKQQPNESVTEFVIRLKMLAERCEFGNFIPQDLESVTSSELRHKALESALIDKIIMGIGDSKTQQMLLEKRDLNFQTCVDLALTIELSKKNQESIDRLAHTNVSHSAMLNDRVQRQRSLSHQRSPESVWQRRVRSPLERQSRDRSPLERHETRYRMSPNRERTSKQQFCRRCGKSGSTHTFSTCKVKGWKCYTCGKFGHKSTMCENKSDQINNIRQSNDNINTFKESKTQSSQNNKSEYSVQECNLARIQEFEVEGVKFNMEVDTGSPVTILSYQEYKEKLCHLKLTKKNGISFTTVSDSRLKVLGSCMARVRVGERVHNLEFFVIATPHKFRALFGRHWLDAINPSWRINIISSQPQ